MAPKIAKRPRKPKAGSLIVTHHTRRDYGVEHQDVEWLTEAAKHGRLTPRNQRGDAGKVASRSFWHRHELDEPGTEPTLVGVIGPTSRVRDLLKALGFDPDAFVAERLLTCAGCGYVFHNTPADHELDVLRVIAGEAGWTNRYRGDGTIMDHCKGCTSYDYSRASDPLCHDATL